jgi:putative endonuclease
MNGPGGNKELGDSGERAAEVFFAGQGFEVVARNFRCGRVGEIDLIVRKGDFFVFAEIKTRSSAAFGGAVYSLSQKKKNRMRKTAGFFIDSARPQLPRESVFRFDLVSIGPDGIEWIQDIIR